MRAMKFFSVRTTLIALIASLVIFGNAQAEIVPGRYIVVFRDDVVNPRAAATSIAQANGLAVGHVYSSALRGFSASIPDQALQGVMRNPKVAYIEPDLIVHAVSQTLPTGVNRIDVDQNATAKIDGIDERVDVDIAIIDTGIDIDHPDLEVVDGIHYYTVWPFQFWDSNCDDDNGHGTHVAGIAAALDNDYGVVGVAPGARLWAVKVLNASGSGYVSDLVAGIDWVATNAANIEVANMSLSWQGNSSAARTAIINSVAAGVVFMVAASNEIQDVYGPDGVFGTSDDYEPASYPEVATIAAMSDTDGQPGGNGPPSSYDGEDRNGDGVDDGVDDSFAWFSNYSNSVVSYNPVDSPGQAIDLLLPGVDIYSTVPPKGDRRIAHRSGYNSISGTSMASPHGAGLAALYIADNGRATNAAGVYAIRQALIDNGVQQTDIRGLAVQNDPDVNNEHIGWACGTLVGSPPTVAWVNPVDGSTVAGTVDIWINASDAEDAEGSLAVEWCVDGGIWQSTSYTGNYYEASWDSTTVSDGNHTLDTRGTDSDGNAVTDSITVTTENVNDPPVVSWINPGNGDTVAGAAIAIQINASDDLDTAGYLTVEWRVDNGDWQSTSYTGNCYEASWDSTSVSDGVHTLGARATDSGSNVSTSDITVTVNNISDPSVSLYAYDISWSKTGEVPSFDLIITADVRQDSDNVPDPGDDPAISVTADLWLIHDTNKNGTFAETFDDIYGKRYDENWLLTGVTDVEGKVTFTLNSAPRGDYKAIVGPLLPGADPPWHDIPFGDNPDWYFGFPNGGEADPSAKRSTASVTQLDQNYPNPPNPETWIPFKLSKPERVVIRIYNAAGRLVRTLDLGAKAPGAYVSKGKAAYWDGRNEAGEKVTSGIYFYVMEAGSFRAMRKMIILK